MAVSSNASDTECHDISLHQNHCSQSFGGRQVGSSERRGDCISMPKTSYHVDRSHEKSTYKQFYKIRILRLWKCNMYGVNVYNDMYKWCNIFKITYKTKKSMKCKEKKINKERCGTSNVDINVIFYLKVQIRQHFSSLIYIFALVNISFWPQNTHTDTHAHMHAHIFTKMNIVVIIIRRWSLFYIHHKIFKFHLK